jgi:hypothetical protein
VEDLQLQQILHQQSLLLFLVMRGLTLQLDRFMCILMDTGLSRHQVTWDQQVQQAQLVQQVQ